MSQIKETMHLEIGMTRFSFINSFTCHSLGQISFGAYVDLSAGHSLDQICKFHSWQYQIYSEFHFLVMVHGPVHLPPHILAVTMKHDTPVI